MNISPALQIALWPLSVLYGAAARIRAWLYAHHWLKQKRLNAPVISVGNLTVGGTGKTPMVLWLAERFVSEGKRVAILSRGYRGRLGTSDEVEVMKQRLQQRVLFGVGKDRYGEGQRLQRQGVDIFLLDDGFQHLQLARDVDIVLIDATRPLWRQALIPAGTLREPIAAVNRADLVLFTRTDHAPDTIWAMWHVPRFPVFPTRTKLVGLRRYSVGDRGIISEHDASGPFFAFCAVGNPEAFFEDLKTWGIRIAGQKQFRDHHRYTAADISAIEESAKQAGAKALLTTEKDEQNLHASDSPNFPVYVAVVSLEVPDEVDVLGRIRERIRPQRGAAA